MAAVPEPRGKAKYGNSLVISWQITVTIGCQLRAGRICCPSHLATRSCRKVLDQHATVMGCDRWGHTVVLGDA
jgi:hypothetical protein